MKAICLNLTKRIDRWDSVQKEFNKINFKVERFAAIEHADPKISFNLSQQAILRSITEPTIVFEDDVLIHHAEQFNTILESAPEDWEMLYFGGNVMDNLKKVNDYWWRCKETWTTHAIAYTPEAAKKILEGLLVGGNIYDEYLRAEIQEKLNVFICKPFLASQAIGYSDLWERETDYGILHTQSKLHG